MEKCHLVVLEEEKCKFRGQNGQMIDGKAARESAAATAVRDLAECVRNKVYKIFERFDNLERDGFFG